LSVIKPKLINSGNVAPMHARKAYSGTEVYLHSFLTSIIVEGERSTSQPGRFTLGKYLPVVLE
jgi:hypothetical protein